MPANTRFQTRKRTATSPSVAGLTIAELSERLQVKHHSAVNLLDRFVERKLIIPRHRCGRPAAKTFETYRQGRAVDRAIGYPASKRDPGTQRGDDQSLAGTQTIREFPLPSP
jgi:hypothetical protein